MSQIKNIIDCFCIMDLSQSFLLPIFFLSLYRTHTHTHSHTLSFSRTHAPLSICLPLVHSLTSQCALIVTSSLSHSHTHSHSLIHTLFLFFSLSLSNLPLLLTNYIFCGSCKQKGWQGSLSQTAACRALKNSVAISLKRSFVVTP